MWMRNAFMRRLVCRNQWLRRATFGVQNRIQMALLSGHKHPHTLKLLKRASRRSDLLLSSDEAFVLYEFARAQAAYPGAIAELGVYQGASAAIIAEAKQERELNLFDTFRGLPEMSARAAGVFEQGQFEGPLEQVQRLLAAYDNVNFYPGIFPASTLGLVEKEYSFVHLDADLYEATLEGLTYFYPRMRPGGIILAHDYSIIDDVQRAFTEFFYDKCEMPIELPTTQAFVICQPKSDATKV